MKYSWISSWACFKSCQCISTWSFNYVEYHIVVLGSIRIHDWTVRHNESTRSCARERKKSSVRLLKTYKKKVTIFSMFFRVFFTFIVLSSKLSRYINPMEATQFEIPKANQRKRLLWRYASNYKTVMPGLFSAKPEPRTDGKK